MAAEKMTNLPSGSGDAIPKDATADEFVKATKWGTTGVFAFQAATSAPNRPYVSKTVSDMLESRGYKLVNLKTEKNGSFLMNFELRDGGVSVILPDRRNYDPEIENQKVIRFLNARMFTEFPGGDKKDVVIAVENHKLVMELNTMLEDYGKIKKCAELPDGVTASAISTLMEDQTLTVAVALEKPEPEEKPKSMISKIKGALAKAWPGCLAIGAKMGFDAITDDDAN